MPELTPFQTVGPFFALAFPRPGDDTVVWPEPGATRIVVEGTVTDGAGAPVPDAVLETWQADGAGRYHHPDDPRGEPAGPPFAGLARAATDAEGRYRIHTVRPGPVPGPDGRMQAAHLALGLLARGVLTRLVTRVYFEGDPALADDPVLALVPEPRRPTLIARRESDARFRFDVVLQGPGETVFFDV